MRVDDNALRPHERQALHRAGITPMTLAAAGCWGHRSAPICTDCARLQVPAEYSGAFPAMQLLVPAAQLREELVGGPTWFCADRRSAGTHAPSASVAGAEGLVCAAGNHAKTLEPAAQARNPALLGGTA